MKLCSDLDIQDKDFFNKLYFLCYIYTSWKRQMLSKIQNQLPISPVKIYNPLTKLYLSPIYAKTLFVISLKRRKIHIFYSEVKY